jgi:hypothetical protein
MSEPRMSTSLAFPSRTCWRSSLIGTVRGAVLFAITPWTKRSAARAMRRYAPEN